MASSLQHAEDVECCNMDLVECDESPSSEFPLLAINEELEDDVFEDAVNHMTDDHAPKYDLQESFEDCDRAIILFFNNNITGATAIMKPWSHSSLYHSLGFAIFEFIPAVLTFDRAWIERASVAIKNCITVCNKHRKQYTFVESLSSIIKKHNYASFTDLEAHAELCYAEAMLLSAALQILELDDLTSLIKSSLKIKTCYATYQFCWNMIEFKKFDTDVSKLHFKSGVKLGTASFNLMISLLPPRIVSLLEFVGFSGNKYYGLAELQKGARNGGMRALLCDLVLLTYHLVITHLVGGRGDDSAAITIIDRTLEVFPNSVWFLVFRARYLYLQGHLANALDIYRDVARKTKSFKQFRHICYWEMMWIHALRMEYRYAAEYAELLFDESSWSKTTHCYIRAAMLMQNGGEHSRADQLTIGELMRNAPSYKQRIAGKSLPMEKFVIKRCARYHEQCCRLVLPALELLCIWNLFPLLKNNRYLMQNTLRMIERNTELLDMCEGEWWSGHKGDNKALLVYMHGCALSANSNYFLAVEKFNEVLKMKSEIKEDVYLLPYALCEIGWCYYNLGDMEKAQNILKDSRKKYSGYALESRLHFRVHARLDLVRDVIGNTKFTSSETE